MKTQKWTPEENAALIAAYLRMQQLDFAGAKFSKTAIRRELIAGPLAARSEASIEFKLMNVSGCMRSLGRLPLRGYQPAMNYQRDLMAAVVAALGITAEKSTA
jgi:5-methylcytosine-specific restriction enzyme A